ncbi:MAG: acyl-CoA acyltransferase [Campylobacterota bacterium]|nr:acyl-CoA acyltransferase [Campylobacterota bacterium]
MSIKIRKAEVSDCALVSWAMLESSRSGKKTGLFDLIFQCHDDKVLLEKLALLSQTKTKSYCHYSNFLVAVEDSKDVGVLCGYEPRIATHEVLSQALMELDIDESYNERIQAHFLCLPKVDRQTWVLDFMEVKDDAHEFTVLKELVQKSLLTARLKGYRKVETMVEIGSAEVQLSYKKLGFDVQDEIQNEEYFATFGRSGIMRLGIHL